LVRLEQSERLLSLLLSPISYPSSFSFFLFTEDGVLHIELTKAEEASTWPSAIAGHLIDTDKQQADQKRLMLERFQQEHPGFDFSGAQFTGDIPDPRTFMKDLDK
jgi:hypothetical protein